MSTPETPKDGHTSGAAYVEAIGSLNPMNLGRKRIPRVVIRFAGSEAEQEDACRQFATLYGVRGQALLGAAADMADALKQAEDWLDCHSNHENEPGAAMLISIVRAALKKAGRRP